MIENSEKNNPIYLDPTQSIEKRVEDLISRMTVEEKVAQLRSYYAYEVMDHGNLSSEKMHKLIRNGISQITRIGGTSNMTPESSVKISNGIQRFLNEKTRLGIPAIVHEEALCGYTAKDAIVFPQIIGVASTWEPELAKSMGQIIQKQLRAVGAHQALSPVLDVARDPRWGRTEETYGEDPYLISRMGVAYIRGLQGESLKTGIIATGKHFVGYGLSQGGRNWAPSFIPPRELIEVFAKPFEAAIHEANIGSIMNAYQEIDGIPIGISHEILTELLRNKLKFKRVVVSDYATIPTINLIHRLGPKASEAQEAAILAFNAGLEVELPTTVGYGKKFVKAINNGRVSEDKLNQTVSRILTEKFELGLFDNPYVDEDPQKIKSIYTDPKNKELARKIALKSIVLLKNENNLLPIDKNIKSIAVIGPNADSVRNLLGDYSYVSQFEATVNNSTRVERLDAANKDMLMKLIEDPEEFTRNSCDIISILEAIKTKISETSELYYVKGCEILGDDKNGFDEAVDIAKKSDIAILVMGGKSGLMDGCTSGESRDRSKLTLTGVQVDLIRSIHATGTPIVLVLINGRPLSIPWENENIPAILEAWLPGQEGAGAVADVIFGDYNPGGKLPISIPRSVGQVPLFHNHKPTSNLAVFAGNYVDENTTPLFPFGYGLSYTQFEYSNLIINKPKVDSRDQIKISCDVKNIGKLRGEEVVQLYLHDLEALVTRPVEELFGFKRVALDPGEKAEINFTISMKQLGFYNEKMEFIVEPGNIEVFIGSANSLHGPERLDIRDLFSKKDVKLRGKFEITGETIDLSKDKEFFSKVDVRKL